MSYYYKYDFISPEGIYATVKEELRSYMDAGVVDDLMFPTYLNKCLDKLGKATYMIVETILYIEDFKSRLPDNFHAVREAWLCTQVEGGYFQDPSSFYSQTSVDDSSDETKTLVQIIPATVGSEPYYITCLDDCSPNEQQPYKVTSFTNYSYKRKYLLKPGNISATDRCDVNYTENWRTYSQEHLGTPYSSSYDSFDIRDNKFVTNFRKGVVDLVFYATDYDNVGNQLVPDNHYIKEYIEAFIKYKMFEQLMNLVTDETINQIERKVQYYKQLSDEGYILALSELRKQTMWQKQRGIKKSLGRLDRYELPGDHRRNSTWRRNR